MKRKLIAVMALLFVNILSLPHGFAQGQKGSVGVGAGGGIYITPFKGDIQVHGDYFVTDRVSLGMNFEVIVPGANFSVVPFARYHFNLKSLPRFSPYVGMGVGFASFSQEDSFGLGSERTSLLDIMAVDLGFKYQVIPDRLFLGSDVSFHIVTDFNDHGRELRFLPVIATIRF